MLADIGTKPLQASRMAYLKKGLNMGRLEIEDEEKNEGEYEDEKKGGSTEDVERILKMIVCMAMVQGAEAQRRRKRRVDMGVTGGGDGGLTGVGGDRCGGGTGSEDYQGLGEETRA